MKKLRSPRRLIPLLTFGCAIAWAQNEPAPASSASSSSAIPSAATTPAPDVSAAPAVPAATTAAPAGEQVPTTTDHSNPLAGTLAGSLDSTNTISAIQRQEFEKRDQLLKDLTERVQKADQQINELKQKNANLTGANKDSLDASLGTYERNKARLQQDLEAARNADAATWERARSAVASDYAFFVSGAAGVEVAAPN